MKNDSSCHSKRRYIWGFIPVIFILLLTISLPKIDTHHRPEVHLASINCQSLTSSAIISTIKGSNPDCIPDIIRSPYLDRYGLNDLWSVNSGEGVTVAMIDTGVTEDVKDLSGKILPGFDTIGSKGRIDFIGHGTEGASIIAAEPNNGSGIAGIAPGAKILPINIFGSKRSAYDEDIVKGIYWAVEHGADIINMSFAGVNYDKKLYDAIMYAQSRNVVVVAAAGNYNKNKNPITYPASFPGVIAVGSIDSNGSVAPFSETGKYITFVAPGISVPAIDNNDEVVLVDGTSISAPIVSGLIAIYLSMHPDTPRNELVSQIKSKNNIYNELTGFGEVDLSNFGSNEDYTKNILSHRYFGESKVFIDNQDSKVKSNIYKLYSDSEELNPLSYFSDLMYSTDIKEDFFFARVGKNIKKVSVTTLPKLSLIKKNNFKVLSGYYKGTAVILYDKQNRILGSSEIGKKIFSKLVYKFCLKVTVSNNNSKDCSK